MIANFLNKFFGFFDYGNGCLDPFTDNLGEGSFGYRHIIWILATILLVVVILSLKNKNKKEKVYNLLKILLVIMFFIRFARQAYITFIGAESPFWRAIFPIHLCSIMIYLLPIVVLFNLKKIKKPVYFLSILGGMITIIDGGYFDSRFMTFSTIEGIYAHTLIFLGSIFMLQYESERFDIKDCVKSLIGIILIAVWATIFNVILGTFYSGSNYLYLVENKLPIFDNCFIFIYLLIFIILLACFYIIVNIKHKKELINDLKNNWKLVMYALVVTTIMAYVITIVTKTFAVYG